MAKKTIPAWVCEVCAHVWPAESEIPPPRCSKCKSRAWNKRGLLLDPENLNARIVEKLRQGDRPRGKVLGRREGLRTQLDAVSPAAGSSVGKASVETFIGSIDFEVPLCEHKNPFAMCRYEKCRRKAH